MKKSTINVIIAAIAAIVLGCVLVSGFQDRNKAMNSITVTGMSQKDFTSDLIVWQGSYTIRNFKLAEGYKKLHGDAETVKNYLLSQGLKPEEFVFSSVNFYKDFSNSYNRQTGESTSVFNGYVLSQNVQITSKDVNKIEALSRDVTSLINKGIEFSSDAPEYYYTKLSELKLEMIAAASDDGRKRAEQIVENAGGKIKDLQSASLGVFQITAQNANENYSAGGAFNTWSKDKTVSVTVRLKYQVK